MLIPSHINSNCRYSWVDNGDCCCNCIHRYLLTTKDGFPVGFVCKLSYEEYDDEHILNLDYTGHGICEMHMRDKKTKSENV